MKRIFLIFFAGFLITSCNNEPATEEILSEIDDKRKSIKELESEITSLQEKINTDSLNAYADTYQVPVEVKEIMPEAFDHFIEVNGTVSAIEEAYISPETNGQIKAIYVDEGDRVYQGQLLARLNSSVIDNNIIEAETSLELAEKVYLKQKELWDQQIGSEIQFLEAKNRYESAKARLSTLKAQLDMANIKAPFAGIVDDIMLKEGELASPGMQLIQLVNLKQLKVLADISERYLNSIEKGDKVTLQFPAFPEIEKEVTIKRVGQVINPQSRTFEIEMHVPNNDENLKPNIISTVLINDFSSDSALVVPSIIIKEDNKGSYLYKAVAGPEGNFRALKTYVIPQMYYQEEAMIKEGISSGDRVVTTGYTLISDGVGLDIQ